MKNTNRIFLIAVLAALASIGVRAQDTSTTSTGTTTGETTSGGTTTGGTTTGGTTTGGTTTGGTTTGGTTTETTTTGGSTTTTTETTTTSENNGKAKGKEKGRGPQGPNENASDTARAVHGVIADFRAQREAYLTDRKALLESLKGASEEAKAAILSELRKMNEERETEERSLGKQIREELRGLRGERKSGGE
jgi:hypothetical protein